MLIVGLTGNYGMGKSTVLKMFGKLGAVTLEADDIVDSILHDESVLEKIRTVLGNDVFSTNGKLDRARVASIIFRDKTRRDDIEKILHPLVFEKMNDFLDSLDTKNAGDKIVIIEIPLMFEKGYAGRFHKTVTVYVDNKTTLRRLKEAGVSKEDALLRLSIQMPVEEKIRMSDFIIDNSGTVDETEAQVKVVYSRLMEGVKSGCYQRA